MDGYSKDESKNFAIRTMQKKLHDEQIDNINKGLNDVINRYSKEIEIHFVTTPRFVSVE